MRHKSFLYEINSFCRSILSVFLNGYLANVRFIVKILKSGLTLLKDSSKIVIKEKEKPVRKPYIGMLWAPMRAGDGRIIAAALGAGNRN